VERAIVTHEVDTVFHLGAQTIVSSARRTPRATFETNVRGTWNVLEAGRVHADQVQAVVVASSDKAYGEQSSLPYTEESSLVGVQPYEASKSCADLIATSYAVTYDLPVAIARCGNIFGGGDLNWSRIVPGTIRSLVNGEQPVLRSDGTFKRDYLHVDDVVHAYRCLAGALDRKEAWGRAYNFSDEHPLTVWEMYEAVCRAMGAEGVEPLVLDRAAGEIHDQYLDATRARTELDWQPAVALEAGLTRTVDWYRRFFATGRRDT
jgi:CDP-glucose 4,6-dehydratase